MTKKAEKESMTWEELNPLFVRFDNPGDEAEGRLIAVETVEIGENKVQRYVLQSENGPIAFLGTVQLDDRMARVALEELVKVVFAGWGKSSRGRRVKEFKVYVARESS